MTSEQIAEIREWVAHPAAGGMVPIQAHGLTKLLDEREALLRAMYQLRDGVWRADFPREHARAAIAKAEAP